MIDQISYKTKIMNVADDGSVTMKVKLMGVTLKVIGDSAAVIFSTIDNSFNKSPRSKEYSQVFRFLNDTPFTATVSPDGNVTSISGKIEDKIQKVKNLIPEEKVNGKSIKFFTNQILSQEYLKNVLSVGWIHKDGKDIPNGKLKEKVIETPPIPGDPHAEPASIEPVKIKRNQESSPETYQLKTKVGFGNQLDLGAGVFDVLANANMMKTAELEMQDLKNGASYKMWYKRENPNNNPY